MKNENEALGELSVDIPCYFDHLTFTCFIIFIQFDFPSDGNNPQLKFLLLTLATLKIAFLQMKWDLLILFIPKAKEDLTYTLTRYLF